ncbi:MAG: AraC family transcriptional regulator [Verrucomicrobiaceae bacterium]|nr:MAG: AraC family transcriptional regulator [Verrucomicrobiaceae bacterium]
MQLHFADSNQDVAEALNSAFSRFSDVQVHYGDLLTLAEYCIVSPANSSGFMDGGFDQALLGFFGPAIESRVRDAISRRPKGLLPVGASLLVRTGNHRVPFLIVAPTMIHPEQVEASNAYRAMRAVLRIARELNGPVFCPGLCTGVGNVSAPEAAKAMALAYAQSRETV